MKKNKGFTLIELLIVMLIIGIIGAMGLLVARKRAVEVQKTQPQTSVEAAAADASVETAIGTDALFIAEGTITNEQPAFITNTNVRYFVRLDGLEVGPRFATRDSDAVKSVKHLPVIVPAGTFHAGQRVRCWQVKTKSESPEVMGPYFIVACDPIK